MSDPANYRGIAVSNSLCKIFCSVLNNRLLNFFENHDVIPKNQIGFQRRCRTADHILTLKTIIDKYTHCRPSKHVYTCFVDLKAAFDTVWRDALFFKLLKNEIGGNFLGILIDMYKTVDFCVKLSPSTCTQKFPSNIGVKQGCVLSPALFNLYLSDL